MKEFDVTIDDQLVTVGLAGYSGYATTRKGLDGMLELCEVEVYWDRGACLTLEGGFLGESFPCTDENIEKVTDAIFRDLDTNRFTLPA